jgi:Icc-related predicted phosphoesterase
MEHKDKKLTIAALADLHVGATVGVSYADLFKEISSVAHVLVLCGDLTNTGSTSEAELLARDLSACSIPVVGVLGNHDHESGHPEEVERILMPAGFRPLHAQTQVIEGIGFAGVKGFGGGFGRHMLGSFGEAAIKHFVEETVGESLRLENALHHLIDLKRVVVVLHYAPIAATAKGEPPEIYPYLGSSRFEETIDRFENVSAIFHGHAHHGAYRAATRKNVPVYNCAYGVAKEGGRPYGLVEL